MAKRKAQEQPAGSPAWMSTFAFIYVNSRCRKV